MLPRAFFRILRFRREPPRGDVKERALEITENASLPRPSVSFPSFLSHFRPVGVEMADRKAYTRRNQLRKLGKLTVWLQGEGPDR